MNRPRPLLLLAVLLAGLAAVPGCRRSDRSADRQPAGPPVIVATIYPLADLAGQLAGEHARVVCLVPPGISPHGFEPNARQMQALQQARLLVTVGLGLDHWTSRAVHAAGNPNLPVVEFARTVGLAGVLPTSPPKAPDDQEHPHHHDHGPVDPHLWLDPVLCRRFVRSLADQMAQVLDQAAPAILAHARQLDRQLAELDRQYAQALQTVRCRQMVTVHPAFNRLARRYGLEVVATLMPAEGPGTMTSDRLADAIATIRQHRIKTIFTEPQFPADLAETLARQSGATVLTLDPLGNPHQPRRAGYLAMMRYNLQVLTEGLNR